MVGTPPLREGFRYARAHGGTVAHITNEAGGGFFVPSVLCGFLPKNGRVHTWQPAENHSLCAGCRRQYVKEEG